MTSNDIDTLARKREPLPESAGLADMMLYTTLTSLYEQYASGTVSLPIAKNTKARAIERHKTLALAERCYREHMKRITEINALDIGGHCPNCRKMYDIFSGYRERKPNER